MARFRQPPQTETQEITLQEIGQVLADAGYSAGERSGWLKQVLTELEQSEAGTPTPARRELIRSVKELLRDEQDAGSPIADDVL
jgi:hypothetical protein